MKREYNGILKECNLGYDGVIMVNEALKTNSVLKTLRFSSTNEKLFKKRFLVKVVALDEFDEQPKMKSFW